MLAAMITATPVLADSGVGVSGRAYNLSTGAGYGNVTIDLCNGATAVTNSSGNWYASLPQNSAYCARVISGMPGSLSAPATRNNSDVGASNTYENQVAGVDCYHQPSCPADFQRWDRSFDGGVDFAYSKAAPVQPAPAVSVSPATPAPTTQPVALE